MKKSFIKRIISILMIAIMLTSFSPFAFDAWKDGRDCEVCQEIDGGVHCPECQNCYTTTGVCVNDDDHCRECCLICEACDTCVFEDGLELCPECNLCELCCQENVQS